MGPLLVTGGTGYLGGELLRQAAGRPLAATYLSSYSSRPTGRRGLDRARRARRGRRERPAGARAAAVLWCITALPPGGRGRPRGPRWTGRPRWPQPRRRWAPGSYTSRATSSSTARSPRPTTSPTLRPRSPTYGRAKADAELARRGGAPRGAARADVADLRRRGCESPRAARNRGGARRGRPRLLRRRAALPGAGARAGGGPARAPRAPGAGCPEPRRSRGGEPLRVRVPGGRRGGASHRADPAHVDRGGPAHAPAQLRARQRTRRRAAAHAAAGARAPPPSRLAVQTAGPSGLPSQDAVHDARRSHRLRLRSCPAPARSDRSAIAQVETGS